eukprot:scaffold11885_cov129-Isochrysis_galbana.AAC.2
MGLGDWDCSIQGNYGGRPSASRDEVEHILIVEVVGAHAEATHVLVVVLGPRKAHVAMVLVVVQLEKERVESIIITNVRRQRAATAWRIGSAPCESPGTRKRRPSLCTSVSVIGLSLAASTERMEVKNRGCDIHTFTQLLLLYT